MITTVWIDDHIVLMQYAFDSNSGLYNIELMSPQDEEREFYNFILDLYSGAYGVPVSETDNSATLSDPAVIMMKMISNNGNDIDIVGWNADSETVIVLSRDPHLHTIFVEIRQYKHYF